MAIAAVIHLIFETVIHLLSNKEKTPPSTSFLANFKMDNCSQVANVSSFFSTVSLLSWICAQMPQIFTNYKTKSAEGISPLFLLLWFMGDFLSFTSCLLNDVVLKFQVYLSLFFICNDLTLCYQYYYYNSVYPRKNLETISSSTEPEEPVLSEGVSKIADVHSSTNHIHIRGHTNHDTETLSLSQSEGSESSSFGSTGRTKKAGFSSMAAVGTFINAGVANAMAIPKDGEVTTLSKESLGLFLAWCCTAVYVSSRCPQLYKNYKRKSVDGISPLLFGSALIGNLTYTLSILTSCDFVEDSNKTQFFWRQLPYILGSSGTVVFDIAYFYQRYLYRDYRLGGPVMLESWESIESRGEQWD